jgi:hypothetical protein
MVHKKRMIFIWEKLVPSTSYTYSSSMDGDLLEIEELENLKNVGLRKVGQA